MNKSTTVSLNSAQTFQLGETIGKRLRGGEVFLLHGDLGSGKTTFSQGIAKGLGVKGRVISPTFLIVRSYDLTGDTSPHMLYHIDAYRLRDSKDAEGLGLKDIFSEPTAVVVCEWPERIIDLLPEKRKDIYFTYVDENTRKIEIHEKL